LVIIVQNKAIGVKIIRGTVNTIVENYRCLPCKMIPFSGTFYIIQQL